MPDLRTPELQPVINARYMPEPHIVENMKITRLWFDIVELLQEMMKKNQ